MFASVRKNVARSVLIQSRDVTTIVMGMFNQLTLSNRRPPYSLPFPLFEDPSCIRLSVLHSHPVNLINMGQNEQQTNLVTTHSVSFSLSLLSLLLA